MPTAAVARGVLVTVGLATTLGAVIASIKALVDDRRVTKQLLTPQE